MLTLKPFNGVSTELSHLKEENKWFCCPEEARGNNSKKDIWMYTLHLGRKVTETRAIYIYIANQKLKFSSLPRKSQFQVKEVLAIQHLQQDTKQ